MQYSTSKTGVIILIFFCEFFGQDEIAFAGLDK